MATCSSFHEIFEKPLPENPTLIESLASSWKKIKAKQQAEICSYTEIFGELHFKENLDSSPSSGPLPPSPMDAIALPGDAQVNDQSSNRCVFENKEESSLSSLFGMPKTQYSGSAANKGSSGFSSKKPGSLRLCTEGLGFESSDEVENSKSQSIGDWKHHGDDEVVVVSVETDPSEKCATKHPSSGDLSEGRRIVRNSSSGDLSELRRARSLGSRDFPPPISCIGRNGKPWVCLKSFRHSGRFVLKEIKIHSKEVLHACREDGRLTLHLVVPEDEDILEEGEEEPDSHT